jgi:hypothetical protein
MIQIEQPLHKNSRWIMASFPFKNSFLISQVNLQSLLTNTKQQLQL